MLARPLTFWTGLLHHESSLAIREHYTDTDGATEHVFALAVPVAQPSRIHLRIGELGSATILNTSGAFVLLLIVLQKLDDHFQIP
jgi:hypothetical protein